MRSTSFYRLFGSFALASVVFLALAQIAYAATIAVNVSGSGFSGKVIDITPGDTVRWTNTGTVSYTVTADNNSFDSGPIAPSASFSQVFSQPGNYPYYSRTGGAPGGVGISGIVRVAGTAISTQTPIPTGTTNTTVTNTTVNAQAQSLLAQIAQLQQILAGMQAVQPSGSTVVTGTGGVVVPTANANVPGGGGVCPNIGRVLKPGMSGEDVRRLQTFLATDPSVYPNAQITGYYGSLTQAAVQRWQTRHNIVASGSIETTGFGMVGPRTAAAMSLQCSQGGGTSVGGTGAPVGGFLQVTPIAGTAPLTVSVTATVNTVNSCLSATYVLDWGDGSATQSIPVSANTCKEMQHTFTHTYTYGGQYTVKLSAGGHESTALVSVNGPVRPDGVTGSPSTITITSPSGGQNFTSGNTITISWQTGAVVPGATIVLDLFTGAGQKVSSSDVIAITAYGAGSIQWTIPGPSTGTACPAIYPGRLCGVSITTGSYKIRATVHQSVTTAGQAFGPILAQADSNAFTIIAGANLPTDSFSASKTSGDAPLSVTFSGTLTSNNDAWCASGCFNLLRYGDGAADFIALPISQNSAKQYSISHTYQNPGTYTAVLYQGEDAASITVASPIKITVGGTTAAGSTYGPFTVGPASNTNELLTRATFSLNSGCAGYRLSWGDGSADDVRSESSGPCTQAIETKAIDHAYAQVGTYVITLTRGGIVETLGYTVQN